MNTSKFELADVKEKIAKWLFTNRHRLPNQRFYANWYDETTASPLTEKEYLNLAGELLSKLSPLLEEVKREEREILKLTRQADGRFNFYEDGEKAETYEADENTYYAALPIRMWRHFNKVLDKRIKQLEADRAPTLRQGKEGE